MTWTRENSVTYAFRSRNVAVTGGFGAPKWLPAASEMPGDRFVVIGEFSPLYSSFSLWLDPLAACVPRILDVNFYYLNPADAGWHGSCCFFP